MPRKCKVAAWAMNNRSMQGKTQQEMAGIALDMLESLKNDKPDLVCFPEIFLKTGGDVANPDWIDISRRSVEDMRKMARQMRCYIITSVYEPSVAHPGKKYNSAVLIDRDGNTAGTYHKNHTVIGESEVNGVIPGTELPVFDTDFGRIGMLICFDIGWRQTWSVMAQKGAKMVVWLSAYDGGNLLNTYAAHNMYHVVSSVRTDHAKIIDPTGRTVAESAVWDGLAMSTVNLDAELFHIDEQRKRINLVRRELGDKVRILTYSQENVFFIEPNDPEWPMARIKAEFGLMSYQDYHAKSDAVQKQWREKYSHDAEP